MRFQHLSLFLPYVLVGILVSCGDSAKTPPAAKDTPAVSTPETRSTSTPQATSTDSAVQGGVGTNPFSLVGSGVAFACSDSEDTLKQKKVVSVQAGGASFYIGYYQVSSTNQNPRLARFEGGKKIWCHEDYEITGDDGRGYGLLWDGKSRLYAVFSSTGTQGTVEQDFRRFAKSGWLTSYGSGGGAKVAIVALINAGSGDVEKASFVSAVKSDGKSNSIEVKGLSLKGEVLEVKANSWYSPRKIDTSAMTCQGQSPFPYTLELNLDLSKAVTAKADGCS